ncbi:GntR family transcriptional regulator [Sulfobacillus harzensis]|uniref:GntR family transcriptional regulator n=1 Tax=Sulfobacillus harzensis TaxID=2729629 RepID=A0A7Y0L6W7_9FIRM|nr:GntR family transcriptional regulator [Sulfobacillus harzensis]NMP24133.1 GntR family transcriptional regulator [Sulfobacillus harzensis]
MANPPFETKKDYILRRVKQKILDGEYGPGDRLKVRQLAAEFGTSEIPVREAITQLAATGLVTITPHVGAVASPLSAQDLKEIFEIRSALETLATRLAADRLTPDGLQQIQGIQSRLRQAVDEGGHDVDELNQMNRAFHMAIYHHSENKRLVAMIDELWNHAGRYPGPLTGHNEVTYQSLADHDAILAALKAGDGTLAAQLTEEHKNRAMHRIIALVQEREQALSSSRS